MAYPLWIFSFFSFLGFVLCAIPFPWHLEAWNTGTCLYMAWTGIGCLILFINSIVWNGNAINWAPIWCDISAKYTVGLAVAIPAASLCINRRLYHIASVRTVTISKADKRRAIMVDLAIGLGLPVIEMILQYIPQGHRFNIYEDYGCFPFTYNTPVAYALVCAPPVLIGLVSAVYSFLSIRAFAKSRAQINEFLGSGGHKNLTASRYMRLMCLAGVEVLCTVPLGIYAIANNLRMGRVSPWKGWADTHKGFSRVDQFPAIFWRNNPDVVSGLESTRWMLVACAFVFFGFFGFADEAIKNYRSFGRSLSKTIGLSSGSSSSATFTATGSKSKGFTGSSGNGATLPSFVRRDTTMRKRDSLDSFSDVTTNADEKEKQFSPDLSYGAMSLNDIGGALADYDASKFSPTPLSGSSTSSIVSPIETTSPALPSTAVTRRESGIDIVLRTSTYGGATTLTVPQLSHPTPRSTEVPSTEPCNTPNMV